jgi:hypothetical protein
MSGRKNNNNNNSNDDMMKNVVNKYINDKEAAKANINKQSPDYKNDLKPNDYHSQFQAPENNIPMGNHKELLNSPEFQDIFLKKPYEPKIKGVIKEQFQNGVLVEPQQLNNVYKQPVEEQEQPILQNRNIPEEKRIPFQNAYQAPPQPTPNFFNSKDSYLQDEEIHQAKKFQQDYTQRGNTMRNDSQFFWRDIDIHTLPHGVFYHPNTRLQIRPVELKEIQHIATLDNETIMEARKKLNDLLDNCVSIVLFNGTVGTINDIKEGDRLYLILLLREITFQEGNMLTVSTTCQCNNPIKIELVRQHLEYYDISPDIESYWDTNSNCFAFPTSLRKNPIYMAPPSIGIQTSFIEWAQYRAKKRLPINESFYKIIPYTKINQDYLRIDEIEQELARFEKDLSPELFSYLDDTVTNYMKFGIKGLVKKCSCGREVRTNKVFPRRAKDLFLISGAFRKFTKKHS